MLEAARRSAVWQSGLESSCWQRKAKKIWGIAARLEVSRHTVARWRKRFLESGVCGIEKEALRPGRARKLNVDEIVRMTTQQKPDNATHWSTRGMARAAGVSEDSVRRIWHARVEATPGGNIYGQQRSALR